MSINDKVKLNSGTEMPLFGFGTWKLAGDDTTVAVRTAIESGYRLIDCASIYANEDKVGVAIDEAIQSGKVKREDLFIVSKLWNTHHSKEHAKGALEQTLKDLKVDYLDLYLIHYPASFEFAGYDLKTSPGIPRDEKDNIRFGKATLQETWEAMEDLFASGKVKNIGFCNYSMVTVLDLLTYAKVAPAVLQLELHPYNNRSELVNFVKSKGIHIMSYSTLGSGKEGPMQDPKIGEIAKKYSKTPAQVLLRWAFQSGYTIIPKSSKPQRVKENADIFNFKLSDDEMTLINGMDRKLVVCDTREYWRFPIDV